MKLQEFMIAVKLDAKKLSLLAQLVDFEVSTKGGETIFTPDHPTIKEYFKLKNGYLYKVYKGKSTMIPVESEDHAAKEMLHLIRGIKEAKHDISAMPDSKGNFAKMDKIASPIKAPATPEIEVGQVWMRRYNKWKLKVTKVSATTVWGDFLEDDGSLKKHHSGDRNYKFSHKAFIKDFNKTK